MERTIQMIWGALTLVFATTALVLFTMLPRPWEEPRLVSNSGYSGVIATKNQSRMGVHQYGFRNSYGEVGVSIHDTWVPNLKDIKQTEAELSRLFELLPVEKWSYIRQPGDHGQGSIPRPLKLYDLAERRWRRGLNPTRNFYRLYFGIYIRNEPAIAVTFFDGRTQFESFVERLKTGSTELDATRSFQRIDFWPFNLPNATVFLVKNEESLRVDGIYLWHWAGGLDVENGIGRKEIELLLNPRRRLHCPHCGWTRLPEWGGNDLRKATEKPDLRPYLGRMSILGSGCFEPTTSTISPMMPVTS